jgi:hypothetical protein
MSARGFIRDPCQELAPVDSSALAICDNFYKIPDKNILADSGRSIQRVFEPEKNGRSKLVISVIDSGIGISEEN